MSIVMDKTKRRQCIYCLQTKNYVPGRKKQSVSEFNSEHVMHKSMAQGFRNTPTLNGRVCTLCNQEFGDSIDLVLGRTGYEGLQRFLRGLKSTSLLREYNSDGLKFGALAPRTSGYLEFEVEHVDLNGSLATKVEPFILVHSRKTGHEYKIIVSEISNIQNLAVQNDLDLTRITFATNGTREEDNRIIDLLKQNGISVSHSFSNQVPSPILACSYAPSVEQQRAIAKIAFNYFAYLSEKVAPEISTQPEFNEVRNFIRLGAKFDGMLLIGDALIKGKTKDHSCCLRHVTDNGKVVPVVFVCLFNGFTFAVRLSTTYSDSPIPVEQAHSWIERDKIFSQVPMNLCW